MMLSQQQLYTVIALVGLFVAFIVCKVLDALIEDLDLEFASWVTGFGAILALIYALDAFGAMS